MLGSTSMHLMRKCPCPVWAIKPTRRKEYTRILAAVNAVPEQDNESLLNMKIMELATSLTQMEEKGELHVVHCWEQFFEKMIRGRNMLTHAEASKLNKETGKIHRQWFDKLIDKFRSDGMKPKVHLLAGEPHVLIPELVKKSRIDMVVMGTVARTGLSGFFIGNTAEKIIQELTCSVLAVKPDGFETPVKLD